MPAPSFHRHGIDAETGGYFEPPTSEAELLRRLEGRLPEPEPLTTGVRLDVQPDSLADAGWGIVWPGEIDPAIERALAPLLARRRAQAEEPGPGKFWTFVHHGESAEAFLSAHGAARGGPIRPSDFPYYLLLVGEPTGIPFEFQHRLDRHHLVGRLSFDTPQEYRCYADNVIAVEDGPCRASRAVLFGVRHPDDPPTHGSLDHLAKPLGEALAAAEGWSVDGIYAQAATKHRLLGLLGGDETPSILFTAGHAVCYKPTSRVLRDKQGGLLCADWPGPVRWPGPNRPEHFLIASDLDDDRDLRGLVVCAFGCYTAGTPHLDTFPELVDGQVGGRRLLAPEPFVAALPKRLLGHPRGALAFLGHVDQAWYHSFHWGESPGHVEAFESLLFGWTSGVRLGRGMEPLAERRGSISQEVLQFWLRTDQEDARRRLEADLFIRYHDARGYILLGDPAARPPRGHRPS